MAGIKVLRVSLVGSGVVVCYALFCTPLRLVVFGLVGQPMEETAARIFPWCYADTRHILRRKKLVWFWEIFNFIFGLVFRLPGPGLA